MTPVIDVVMPVRNVTAYLEEAIDSVLAQVAARPRLIVVDAGSDVPVSLPPRHRGDSRIELLRSAVGLHAGGARNLGADRGSAGYLAFLDADDRWPATRSARLVAALHSVNVPLALGQVRHFGSAAEGLHVPAALRPAYLAGGVLLTRATWRTVGPFDGGLRTGEFVEWYTRFQRAGLEAAVVADVTLERRVHAASTTATQRDDRREYLRVVRTWMRRSG